MSRKKLRRISDFYLNNTLSKIALPRYRHLLSHKIMVGRELRQIMHNYAMQNTSSTKHQDFINALSYVEDIESAIDEEDYILRNFLQKCHRTRSSTDHRMYIKSSVINEVQKDKKLLYVFGILCASDIKFIIRLPKFLPSRRIALSLYPFWDHAIRSQIHDIGFCEISTHEICCSNNKIKKGEITKKTFYAEERWKIYRSVGDCDSSKLDNNCIAMCYMANKTPTEFQ